jgi:hypothetical protein
LLVGVHQAIGAVGERFRDFMLTFQRVVFAFETVPLEINGAIESDDGTSYHIANATGRFAETIDSPPL